MEEIKSLPDQYRYARIALGCSRSTHAREIMNRGGRRMSFTTLLFTPDYTRLGVNRLEGFLAPIVKKGLKAVLLFGVIGPHKKVCKTCVCCEVVVSALRCS